MEFLNKLVFFIFLISLGLIEAQSPSEPNNTSKTKNSILPLLFCLLVVRFLLTRNVVEKLFLPKLQFVKAILIKPIQKLLKHFIIIQNITWRNVSHLLTFLKVLLCVGIALAKRFILVLGAFLIHNIQLFILALFKHFHSIQRFIHRLFKLFKLRNFFLCFVLVIQIIVIVYRILLHYKYVYSYENPYEPEIHGTFVQNEQKGYYFWPLFFSFVTNIRDFCGILWAGAEGFGSNNYNGTVPI